MASRPRHTNLTVKHIFVAFFSFFLLASLGIFIYASQNKTSLFSEAAKCEERPKLVYDQSYGHANGVIYRLKLSNNCPNTKNIKLNVVSTPTKPIKFNNWRWVFTDRQVDKVFHGWGQSYIEKGISEKPRYIYLLVGRPFTTYTNNKAMPEGRYQYVKVRASLEKNPSNYDEVNLNYFVEN